MGEQSACNGHVFLGAGHGYTFFFTESLGQRVAKLPPSSALQEHSTRSRTHTRFVRMGPPPPNRAEVANPNSSDVTVCASPFGPLRLFPPPSGVKHTFPLRICRTGPGRVMFWTKGGCSGPRVALGRSKWVRAAWVHR